VKRELRRPLVVGNWKLHNTRAETRALIAALRTRVARFSRVELAVAPVFTSLATASDAIAGSNLLLAAQNVYWESRGAFTGEVSAPLLHDAGCAYVIVGHSERRQLFGEQDEQVQRKVAAVLAARMVPIVCVGESLAQREAGQTQAHVLAQVGAALQGVSAEQAARIAIAYEPIWAIGTGRNASPQDAQAVHAEIRKLVQTRYGAALAGGMRILYGGSVKPDNAGALLAEPDVDGALVGGASLDAESFAAIAAAANS